MRFATITALCAAPLALAGTLEQDISKRGLMGKRQASDVSVVQGQAGLTAARAAGVSVGTGGSISITTQADVTTTEIIVVWVNQGGGAATQTINSAAAAAAPASAATHTVTVGGPAGLLYSPESVIANVGDMVIFDFQSNNHTATQSAFATPCEPLAGGMDTGFVPNVNNSVVPAPQMAMMVSVTTPLWFFCKQTGHCGKGMTFSINPQQGATGGNKTQAAFKQLAIQQNGTALAAPAAAAPAASVTAAAAPAAGLATGTGTMQDGACQCSCLCGIAAFPNAAVQGVDSFGGMSGAMPMSAAAAPV